MNQDTIHYKTARRRRHDFISSNIGAGNIIDEFVVDRGHRNGEEIHSVTDTGLIIVKNKMTNKIITELVARPEQLRRLYHSEGREPPKSLLRLAYQHNASKYNEA